MLEPILKPIDHLALALEQLQEQSETEEKVSRFVMESLKQIPSTQDNLQTLIAFAGRLEKLTESKPDLTELAQSVKRAIRPLCLYSPQPSDSPFASNYIPSLQSVGALPTRLVNLYYDLFVDGKGPWREIFNLVFVPLKTIAPPDFVAMGQHPETEVLVEKTKQLIFLLNSDEDSSLRYPKFIDLIREIANLPCFKSFPDHPCNLYAKKMCYAHYSELKIYPFCEALVSVMLTEGIKQLNTNCSLEDPFLLPLEQQFKCIQAAPQQLKAPMASLFVNRLCGAVSVYFDSHRQTNIPWNLFNFGLKQKNGSEKTVDVIRMGTPTYQRTSYAEMTWLGNANINPEFRLFVERLAAKGERLLFMSLQDESERPIGTENKRNEAQKMVSSQYPEHFFYSILTHDTPFYHQSGIYENTNDAKDFKKTFLDQLLGNQTGFYFPEEWVKDSDFRDLLFDQMESLHYVLFNDRTHLTHKERCSFIQIFYIFLALKLLVKTGADKLVFCCKDSIDRAGIENALLHYILLILTDKEMSKEHLKSVIVYIHAATIIVKQQEMNKRYERLLWAFEILQDPLVRLRIKKRKHLYGIIGNDIKISTEKRLNEY